MRISVRRIQELVAADFNVPLALMMSPARSYWISHPRQVAMTLARELTPLSLTVLGQLFDRDHSTICNGLSSVAKRASRDRNLALKIEARKLLLLCEPKKTVDNRFVGFLAEIPKETAVAPPTANNHSAFPQLGDAPALAA